MNAATPLGAWVRSVISLVGASKAEEARVVAFLDRPDTRANIHAVSLADKPSVATGGRLAWAAFNASGDFLKTAVPLLPPLLDVGV